MPSDLGADLRAVQRAQRAPGRRLDQVQRQPHRQQQRARRPSSTSVRSPCSAQPNSDSAGTAMPSGPPVMLSSVDEHDRDDDAQAERRHRQVVALQPQVGPPDHEREQRDRRRGWPAATAQLRPAVARAQDRRAVAAEREEARMAEADLPGVADQQVQADADDRVQRRPGSRPRRSSCWPAPAAAARSTAPAQQAAGARRMAHPASRDRGLDRAQTRSLRVRRAGRPA